MRYPVPGPIRPEVLRRYYEATYGIGGRPDGAFQGATFEEYHDLLRNESPGILPYLAAKRSPGGVFKPLMEKFAAEYEADRQAAKERLAHPPKNATPRLILAKKTSVDLAKDIPDRNIEKLLLNSIKEVRGLPALAKLKRLRVLKIQLCGIEEPRKIGAVIPLEDLDINECPHAVVQALLPETNAEKITLVDFESPTLDLALMKGHTRLRHLFVMLGFAKGIRHLRGFPLEHFSISDIRVDEALTETLASWKQTLVNLILSPGEPFGPEHLPALPKLEFLKIPGYPEYRKEWIEYAVAHPKTRFVFYPIGGTESPAKVPSAKVAEIHRGQAILEYAQGKKKWYEIWGDFTGGSKAKTNHDVRDALEAQAKKAKLKAEFASEADELMIRAAKPEIVKACLDLVLDGKA
jgi:hypothetical protein